MFLTEVMAITNSAREVPDSRIVCLPFHRNYSRIEIGRHADRPMNAPSTNSDRRGNDGVKLLDIKKAVKKPFPMCITLDQFARK